MRRRTFLSVLGGVAAWPLAAQAQSSPGAVKRPLIGVLGLNPSADDTATIKVFLDALARLGYIDGRSATVALRYAGGNTQGLPALAAELARMKPDVIMADVASAIKAARSAAPDVPIVGASMSYPIEQGLIASFSRPGGNVTGTGSQIEGMTGKLVDLALKAVAGVRTIALLVNPNGANAGFERSEFEGAARQRGIGLAVAEARAPHDIEGSIDALAKAGAAIIFTQPNAMFAVERSRIARLALAKHMAAISVQAQHAESGYLLTYGADYAENYARAAIFVDKILKGAKPKDLPVEFPTKLVFTINLITAKALGIDVPEAVVQLADKVID